MIITREDGDDDDCDDDGEDDDDGDGDGDDDCDDECGGGDDVNYSGVFSQKPVFA